MTELKSWYDFCAEKARIQTESELTQIACPACGRALYKDLSDYILTYPPKYRYFCSACSWMGYA